MYKISELLGLPVISLSNAAVIGTTANVYFNRRLKNAVALKLFSPQEESLYLPFGNILRRSPDSVVVSDENQISVFPKYTPLGKAAFDRKGNYLGRITDVIIKSTGVAAFFIDGSLSSLKLVRCGDVILLERKKIARRYNIRRLSAMCATDTLMRR